MECKNCGAELDNLMNVKDLTVYAEKDRWLTLKIRCAGCGVETECEQEHMAVLFHETDEQYQARDAELGATVKSAIEAALAQAGMV